MEATESNLANTPKILIIIVTYALFSEQELEEYRPRVVVVDMDNRIKKTIDPVLVSETLSS